MKLGSLYRRQAFSQKRLQTLSRSCFFVFRRRQLPTENGGNLLYLGHHNDGVISCRVKTSPRKTRGPVVTQSGEA
ncbi:hypothetical protein INR49_025272 [Caranx melampygus]|nr:hypothetical protein INR49_025272 [Caranx melampygus]